ncbi:MAG TPA: amidohydrolase family protein [Candidatus Binatia bacterium]|jgi:N-acetylglucosamine-6-phosphate deacetylase
MSQVALHPSRVLTPDGFRQDCCVVVESGRVLDVLPSRECPDEGARCVTSDGTLAGSHLTMAAAVRNAERLMGVDTATAVRMASAVPADILGLSQQRGAIRPGLRADLVLLDVDNNVVETWIAGEL